MAISPSRSMPVALYALAAGAFGIGTTEFVIMGLLIQVAADLKVGIATAGLLISGYALGVFAGAPILTVATSRLPRKAVLIGLMAIFTLGNICCAMAPNYTVLLLARVITSLAHGTFFGVGSVVATSLVAADRRASAISIMFTGLTIATLLGVPAGAWLGLHFGWRSTFWAVAAIGIVAMLVITALVPAGHEHGKRIAVRDELRAIGNPSVLFGLLMTVLGFAGVFTVFTYIQPILTEVTGFAQSAVSPILLMFGLGLIAGNLLGGKLADRQLTRALLATLIALIVVLGVMTFALQSKVLAVLFVGLLGIAAFATVPPLQLWVLHKAEDAKSLASSLNIGAFNLGNALGAWLGGIVVAHGPGLGALTWVAAFITFSGLLVALWALRRETNPQRLPTNACA
ncbi:MFS transporter [Dyella sp.]|uniref:MFS transporter n=1 Tax=Dyella sp. TaxID=1869338 RepID=UPI002B473F93|nr:MFS transporter [Dyella sp.]HKT28139.1 MFS transporter [Dyella sp.]